jgi:hypothetical protein
VTDEQVATLVAHAINTMAFDTDDMNGLTEIDPCCRHECAPCATLYALWHDNTLSDAVRPYVVHMSSGCTWDWWASDGDGVAHGWVDSAWLLKRWCDATTCENRA